MFNHGDEVLYRGSRAEVTQPGETLTLIRIGYDGTPFGVLTGDLCIAPTQTQTRSPGTTTADSPDTLNAEGERLAREERWN